MITDKRQFLFKVKAQKLTKFCYENRIFSIFTRIFKDKK